MAYTAPSTVVAGQTYSAAAHNVIVNDVIDHESRLSAAESLIAPFSAAWTSHTPTVTASSGTFTTVSIESRYVKVGKLVIWQGNVTITTAGTASGNIHVPPPVTPYLSLVGGFSWENQVTGNSGYASLEKTNNRLVLAKYDATTYIASGRRVGFNITYEAV